MDEHIKIGDVAPRVQYVADGAQASFTYPFPIFEAADLEVRLDGLLLATGFAVTGAGTSAGGSVVFDAPPAPGRRVTLRRNLGVARTTDFQENGILRARTLNDELDYQVAALQEMQDGLGSALRLDPAEVGGLAPLPLAAARANRLLGFDSTGGVALVDRGEGTISVPFPGAVPRTVEDKLAERLSARDFGALGDGAADDGPALQAAMNAAAASGKVLEVGEGTFRTTMPLTLPGAAAGLSMRGTILYAGPPGHAALTLGDGGAVDNQRKAYLGLSVFRALQSDWLDEADIGIRLRNINESRVEIRRAERFTIGVQLVGDARGCEDSDLHYGRIVDNRIGLDLRTLTAGGWMNALRHHGGHFACASATNPGMGRFGVRLSAAPGAYRLHNANLFHAPAFELQRQGTPGTVDAIPFLIEVDGRGLVARGVRMEACSPFVARHTGGFSDAVYEVAYVGAYGFAGCGVDYAGATRAGGTVLPLHQAAAALGTPRLVAEASSVRARAFRWDGSATGFEGLAVLSGNPAGPPATLNGFCFPGLSSIALNADTVTLPTSRALAFVVDCTTCKEFFLAAEGSGLRPVAMQFDAAEAVLDGTASVLWSNMNAVWQGAPSHWWEGNADLDGLVGGLALNRLQRVTLAPQAAYAVIGVRGGHADAGLKSLRLYVPATEAPMVLAGGGRAWGTRELAASMPYTLPSVAAGGSATQAVTLPNVQSGDLVQAGFAGQASAFLDWSAAVTTTGASGTVTARAANRHATLAVPSAAVAGTLFVRAIKPRA
ncbi:glycosyl hydrolase family 28-related protein [Roseicella aquatilis]|uniref:Hydrolase n=1 Tax=Roseicella aquatilis TaxID=2527868 RepID=A0A4R4D720_9PROT|nr:glycosyl hydrolase family 28-related protein [Roseicella aquatilis]TCZ55551.1 hydrolase [Roseicella aquatilis]